MRLAEGPAGWTYEGRTATCSINQEAKVAVTTPSNAMPATMSPAAASLPTPVVG